MRSNLTDGFNGGRILIVKLSSLGDVVHVTPCLRAIRQSFPRAEIMMAVESRFAAVVRHNPHVDTIIEAKAVKTNTPLLILSLIRLRKKFRGREIDLAIDFQGNGKSAVWMYGCRSRHKIGLGRIRPGWALAFRPDMNQHAIQVCMEVARSAGVTAIDPDPEIFTSREDDEELITVLKDLRIPLEDFLLINPFSTWRSKMWPLERYGEFMRRLRESVPVPMVVSGGPGEEHLSAELMRLVPPGAAVSLVGRLTLGQAFCLYRRARLMVTGDSGPMHAATALGTRVVALFGPTLPERTGPWGKGHVVIQKRRPKSHHAYWSDHDGEHMRAIDIETVYESVRSTLQSPSTTEV